MSMEIDVQKIVEKTMADFPEELERLVDKYWGTKDTKDEIEGSDLAGYKRKRSEDSTKESPEQLKFQKVDVMAKDELIEFLSQMIDTRVAEAAKVIKEEVKVMLTDNIKLMQVETEVLKEEICKLRISERAMKRRVEDLEKEVLSKNLIVKNVNMEENVDLNLEMEKWCRNNMNVDVKVSDVVKFKDRKNRAVYKITMEKKTDVVKILKNKNRLRNTNFFINKDLPLEIRIKRAKLFRLKRKWIESGNNEKFFVKDNFFILGNKKYFLENNRIYDGNLDVSADFTTKINEDVIKFLERSKEEQNKRLRGD